MVAAFDYCLHGKGGAAPSIDTAMHGLVDAAHVDHLHPDSGIAIATAADGEALTAQDLRRQGRVGAVASSRLPARARHRRDQGGQPAGDRLHPRRPRHHGVGRHLRGGRGELAVDHRHRRGVHRRALASRSRSARRCAGYAALPDDERRAKAAALAATIRGRSPRRTGRWSATSPTTDGVLDFLASSASIPRLAALGTSCPDHFLRTKVKPMVLDLPPTATRRGVDRAAARAARGVPRRLPGLLRPQRDRRTRPPIRGADPLIVLVPGRRHVLLRQEQADRARRRRVLPQRDQRDARRRGDSRPTPRSTRRRSSASSTGRSRRPSSQRMPKPKPLATRIALVTGAASRHRQGHRDAAGRRGCRAS